MIILESTTRSIKFRPKPQISDVWFRICSCATKTSPWILLRIERNIRMLRNSKAVCMWLRICIPMTASRILQWPYVIGIYLNVPKCDLLCYIITITIVSLSITSYIFGSQWIARNKWNFFGVCMFYINAPVLYKCTFFSNEIFLFMFQVSWVTKLSRRGLIIRPITKSIISLPPSL